MTGFARARRPIGAMDAVVSLKSVNHRGLDVHFHMPPMLDPFEPLARAVIKKSVGRGHVQVHVALDAGGDQKNGHTMVDTAALERWTRAFRETARVLGSQREPDPNDALRAPGVLRLESPAEWSEQLESGLIQSLEEALEELNAFRDREGCAIAGEMLERNQRVRELAAGMEEIRRTAAAVFLARLREKLGDLLGASAIDPQRVAQEAALLAERSDISEEIMRLKTHAAQLSLLLEEPGEKGKKLDFLLQEMNRETNTVLSKTSGLGDHGLRLTDLALAAKAEIDKLREQSLNLE